MARISIPKKWQRALNKHGFRDAVGKKLKVDGVLGRKTRHAIYQCQNWQKWLNSKGFRVGRADGWPGPLFDKGLKKFQKAAGCRYIDSVVGPETTNARRHWPTPLRRVIRKITEPIKKVISSIRLGSKRWRGICVHYTYSGANTTAEQVNSWHRARGWRKGAYHYFIEGGGRIRSGQTDPKLLRIHNETGAHIKNRNSSYVGVCYAGKDRPNPSQYKSLVAVIKSLRAQGSGYKYGVKGHKELAATGCPGSWSLDKLREDASKTD